MAISATVTATKIDITSTGGVEETFDDVVTAVNAVTAGTITGSGTSGDPYVITTPSNYREFEISSGCEVRFVADTYVSRGNTNTNGTYSWDFASGSIVTIEDGCELDDSGGSATTVYRSYYGQVNVEGTSGNRVVMKGMTRNYMYFNTDDISWDYYDITDMRSATGFAHYFQQTSQLFAPQMTFTNFRVLNSPSAYGIYFAAGGMFANVSMYSFEIDGCVYGAYLIGASAKIGDLLGASEIKNSVNAGVYFAGSGNVVSAAYETAQDDTLFPTGRFQSMGVLENVTLTDNDSGVYSVLAYYNALVQIRDCAFVGDTYSGTQDGIYARYGSVVIEYNNTYTNIDTEFIWNTNSTRLHGRKFDITVTDENGDPLKDATVSIVQGSTSSKERWAGTTDSDGKLLNVFGGSPMFIEKEETSAGVFEQWSNDAASGLCHNVTVTKYGKEKKDYCFEMTEDKDETFKLYPFTGGMTSLKNTEINSATNLY